MKIAIIGSGTAGPTASIFLARAGYDVDLFERAPKKEAVGAGFLLQPTGMAVLDDMGILEELLPHIAQIDRLFCQAQSGKILLDLSYDELREGLYGAGTYRPILLDLLLNHAQKAGVNMVWDRSISCIADNILKTAEGEHLGKYDLVLICDGARSRLRDQTGIPTRVDRYPWGALWYIGKRSEEFDPNTLWQSVHGSAWLNGYLPTGTKDDLLSLFWSIRMDQVHHMKRWSLSEWKDQVGEGSERGRRGVGEGSERGRRGVGEGSVLDF